MNLVSVTEDQAVTHRFNDESFMEDKSESDDSLSFSSCSIEEDLLFLPDKEPCRPIPQTYDWVKDLTMKNDEVAPVQCFRYVCTDKKIMFLIINLSLMNRLLCLIVGTIWQLELKLK